MSASQVAAHAATLVLFAEPISWVDMHAPIAINSHMAGIDDVARLQPPAQVTSASSTGYHSNNKSIHFDNSLTTTRVRTAGRAARALQN